MRELANMWKIPDLRKKTAICSAYIICIPYW